MAGRGHKQGSQEASGGNKKRMVWSRGAYISAKRRKKKKDFLSCKKPQHASFSNRCAVRHDKRSTRPCWKAHCHGFFSSVCVIEISLAPRSLLCLCFYLFIYSTSWWLLAGRVIYPRSCFDEDGKINLQRPKPRRGDWRRGRRYSGERLRRHLLISPASFIDTEWWYIQYPAKVYSRTCLICFPRAAVLLRNTDGKYDADLLSCTP